LRLRWFDYRQFNASDLRQALAGHRFRERAARRVGIGRRRGEIFLMVAGVCSEHDLLSAAPFDKPVWAGADRVVHDPAT
jgi:hypothetical protein